MSDDPSIHSVEPAEGPHGQLAHPLAVEHYQRLTRQMYQIEEHAWCLVGNGLSNQTFIDAPEGIIAIDTGECVEEMRAAVDELRQFTDKPIVACVYTHFHYVEGTSTLLEETQGAPLVIYGHKRIPLNRARMASEIAPRATRGLMHQFGIELPEKGPDAVLHCGLGLSYRNSHHAPYTPGYLPAQVEFDQPVSLNIAGLDIDIRPSPSDADDSVTLWIPKLQLCVNNLVWPGLFNIYAIRGEQFRDPRDLLPGFDHIAQLKPRALLCTHGPPLEGKSVLPAVNDARDAIQFIWDQTIKGINTGLTIDEVAHSVRLPEHFSNSYFTQQLYGLTEHHVRQIYNGLFGWFGEDESQLFPTNPTQRYDKLINGFGGSAKVLEHLSTALEDRDYRWALELATWLYRGSTPGAKASGTLADVLRQISQLTPSANLRNWCLTRALELEGSIDLARFRRPRLSHAHILNAHAAQRVAPLRYLVDADKAAELDVHVGWQFADGQQTGLHFRHGVAVPTQADGAIVVIGTSPETWANILCKNKRLSDFIDAGLVSIDGDGAGLQQVMNCLDLPALAM